MNLKERILKEMVTELTSEEIKIRNEILDEISRCGLNEEYENKPLHEIVEIIEGFIIEERDNEPKEDRRQYCVQNTTHCNGEIVKHDVYLENEEGNIEKVVAIVYTTDEIDSEREATRIANKFNLQLGRL